MGWAKFDDRFSDHPKVVAAGPWGELLAVRAVIYCARFESDGFIPEAQLPRLGVGIPSIRKHARTLVEVGLWEETDGGWQVHDFLDYHPSRSEREQEREDARERMRRVRANKSRTAPEVRESSRYPDPDPSPDTSASDGFTAFHAKRAAAAVRERQKAGLPVKSPGGLARSIADDPEFHQESQRLWAHRECGNCHGKGHTEAYAPGAGTRQVPCEEAI